MLSSFSSRIRLILITASLAFSCAGRMVAMEPKAVSEEELRELIKKIETPGWEEGEEALDRATQMATQAMSIDKEPVLIAALELFRALLKKQHEQAYEPALKAANSHLQSKALKLHLRSQDLYIEWFRIKLKGTEKWKELTRFSILHSTESVLLVKGDKQSEAIKKRDEAFEKIYTENTKTFALDALASSLKSLKTKLGQLAEMLGKTSSGKKS